MKKLFLFLPAFFLFLISCQENTDSKKETQTISSTGQSPQTVLTPKKDSATGEANKTNTTQGDTSQIIADAQDSIKLLQLTNEILAQIKVKNYLAIANYIDPVLGLRFSPYAYVDTIKDMKFSKAAFEKRASSPDQVRIVWGEFDAIEKKIRMTLTEYMQKFVYDVDFAKPEKRSVNEFLGFGNSLNNLRKIYKNCHFTESYFSGFEKKYEGMDWRTLRLVFKERNSEFFLVGIVHDQWTI